MSEPTNEIPTMPSQEQNSSMSSSEHVTINVPITDPIAEVSSHQTEDIPSNQPTTRNERVFIKVDSQISPFGIKSEKSLQAIGMSNMNESEAFPLPLLTDHLDNVFGYDVNEEEKERGFRLLNQPDPLYLGFVPSKHDKRPYLNAMALVDTPLPNPTIFCHMPVSTSQRICKYGSWLILITLFVGIILGAWYIRAYILTPP